MTAPVDTLPGTTDDTDGATPSIAELAVTFPVLVVEGLETSDRRYIEPGALGHRAVPFPVLAQTRNPDGGYGHDGADVIGRIDFIERVPGPTVVSRETGQPFPEGTFVWRGRGVIDADHEAAALAQAGFLTGNSVDLVDCVVDWEWDPDSDDDAGALDLFLFDLPGREVMREGTIGATTLVPVPAFGDAHVVIGEVDFALRRRRPNRSTVVGRLAAQREQRWPSWRAVRFTIAGGRATYTRPTAPAVGTERAGTALVGGGVTVRTDWTDLPVAPDTTGWDWHTTQAQLITRATRADGTLDGARYGEAFLVRTTGGDPDDPTSYQLPICGVTDTGTLHVIPDAVSAHADRLGTDPAELDSADGDALDQVRAALSGLLDRLDRPIPWDTQPAGDNTDATAQATDLAAAAVQMSRTVLAIARELTAAVHQVTTLVQLHQAAADADHLAAQHQRLLTALTTGD